MTKGVQHMLAILPAAIMLLSLLPAGSFQPSMDDRLSDRCHKCGNVPVPYPFGINDLHCALNEYFVLNCTSNSKLFLGENMPASDISLKDGTVIAEIDTAYQCINSSGQTGDFKQHISLGDDGPFRFSDERNKFIGFGCHTLALMSHAEGHFINGSGCVSLCNEPITRMEEASFSSGYGICQTSVPKSLTTLNITVSSPPKYTALKLPNGEEYCRTAFLVEKSSFSSTYDSKSNTSTRVAIEWVAGSGTCNDSLKSQNYACGKNTRCEYSENGQGYRCLCEDGFEGNPYLNCTDIDECIRNHPCEGTCNNTEGSYKCSCPLGTHLDVESGRCRRFSIKTIATVTIGTTLVSIIVFLAVITFKKHRKQKNFLNNGGTLLKHQRVGIFTEAELAKATNNYHSARFLGEGAFGSVYKGTLANDIQVAVKKPKDWGKNTINNEFQSEIGVVSQVNHKNVVKLLGLCLETRVPMLVYEYVSNGTLYEHIHQKKSQILLTWKNRLRIAAEAALALDYFHSLANPTIVHGDVKSANILLDDNFTAKVSDFGASVLMSSGKTNIATVVRGTLGYLDPEYLMTGNLTAKSDVYSFGVVLLELLTGKKPNSAWVGEDSNIIEYFSTALENNCLFQILWCDVVQDDDSGEMEEIKAMAELAKKCVNPSGTRRPPMKLVADELARLWKSYETPWPEQNFEETESSIDESLSCHIDMPDTLELRLLAMDHRVRSSL